MLSEWVSLVPSLIAGLALGTFYFGALWLTVRRLPDVRQPALLVLGSLAGRLSVTLLGIYVVTGGHWAKIGVCLLGFFVMRTIMIQRWQPQVPPATAEGSGGGTQS
jgi:F1F0 ATPase subunit 2